MIATIKKTIQPEAYLGHMTGELCPRCGAPLMANRLRSRWCCNLDCFYHIRAGRVVSVRDVVSIDNRLPMHSRGRLTTRSTWVKGVGCAA
jgi:hypothetical protein